MDQDIEAKGGASYLFDPVCTQRTFTPEDLDDDQKAMRDAALKFADNEVLPRIEAIEAQEPGLMRELLQKAGALGLLMLQVPEKYGGLEQDKTTAMLIAESLTRCGSFAVSLGAHVGIGTLPLVYFGTVEQKDKYLPRLASGEWIAAYALTETGSGSDALAARTRADLSEDGTHYVLNGSKQFITNASFADLFTVFAQIDGDKFSGFLVERDTPGLTIGPEEHKHGIKGSSTCALTFEDMKVPAENVLGDKGKGHRIAFNILNVGRAHLGIGSTGAAKYALSLGATYAKEREQFGSTLSEFGLIRAKLGEMASRVYASESAGYRTAGLIDSKYHQLDDISPGVDDDDFQRAIEEFTIEASIIKVYGSEVLDYVSDEALQIHGGYGYVTEYQVERVVRDSRINRIFEGTNEINRLLLAGTLLKRGLKNRVPLMKRFGAIAKGLAAGETTPPFEPLGSYLVASQKQVERIKCATLFALNHAVKRYMMTIEKEQEVLGAAADMLIDAFVADSAITRAVHYGEGKTHSRLYSDCATLTVEQARNRVFANARAILCAALEGDKLDEALGHLAVVDHWRSINLFKLRDRVAGTVLDLDGWPRS